MEEYREIINRIKERTIEKIKKLEKVSGKKIKPVSKIVGV